MKEMDAQTYQLKLARGRAIGAVIAWVILEIRARRRRP